MPIGVEDVHPIIHAGGLGTRLRNLAPDTAKPMIPVNGRPFVEWIVRWLAAAGFQSATISTCYRAEQFESYFEHRPVDGMHVQCVREPDQLGTGGAIRFATAQSSIRPAAWLILNGDSIVMCDLKELRDRHVGEGTMIARHVDDAGRYGTLEVTDDGQLLAFHEKNPELTGAGLINAGVYLFDSSLVSTIGKTTPLSLEYHVLPEWLRLGKKLTILQTTGEFIDIGTEETLRAAGKFIQHNMSAFL